MEKTKKQKKEAFNKKMTLIVLPLFIIVMVICYVTSDPTPPKKKKYKLPEHSVAYAITKSMLQENSEFEKNGFNEVDCPFADYKHDYCNDSSYVIVSHFKYKNEFGVKKTFNYKTRVKWLGNDPDSLRNWQMMYIKEFTLGM